MESEQNLKNVLIKSGIWTALLTLTFLGIIWNEFSFFEIITSLGFFIMLYFIFFSIGKKEVADVIRKLVTNNIRKAIIFPSILVFCYYSYIIINGHNPFQGTVFMLPYLLYFPTLAFVANANNTQKLDWLDFLTLILFLLPTTLVEFSPDIWKEILIV